MMTNMTNIVNNVANTLRETSLAHIDVDLYHAGSTHCCLLPPVGQQSLGHCLCEDG